MERELFGFELSVFESASSRKNILVPPHALRKWTISGRSKRPTSIISRAPPLISSTAFHAVDLACFYIGETGRPLRTWFGKHRRAVIGNDANQPVARHFSTRNHGVSNMEIRALCPISGSNDTAKDMKCPSFPNLALSTPMVLMNVFLCLTLSVFLSIPPPRAPH
jgi:hypothetical protein